MKPSIVVRPYSLLAELTHSCPLHCPYCSNPLQLVPRGDELSGAIWADAIQQAAALGVLQIGFSGGEPLLHPNLVELVTVARESGLYSNLITSGVGLSAQKALQLQAAGLDTVQISFQADNAETADQIAGTRVHAQKVNAAKTLSEIGIPWSANVVLHRENIDRLGSIITMIHELGAIRIELANTQFYGWAFRNRFHLLPTREQIEQAQATVNRLRRELPSDLHLIYVLPDYYEQRPKPCLHGWASRGMTINPRGDVLPCQAAESIPGLKFDNIKDRDLATIWRQGEAFNRFRGTEWLPEPCQSCDLREIDFGGCRCQAALVTGDAMATDPVCELSPHHAIIEHLIASPISAKTETVWTYRDSH